MKLALLLVVAVLVSSPILAGHDSGLHKVKSDFDMAHTASRLVNALESKGMTVFAQIDHAKGASKAGLELRPTQLVIFGNPKVGTPLMQCDQQMAIDLPQKALIYTDAEGTTWLAYNQPDYLAKRHDLAECAAVLDKVKTALANFATAATQQ